MNILKAIEVLTRWKEPESPEEIEELYKAKELGIQALERRQETKVRFTCLCNLPLEGETE